MRRFETDYRHSVNRPAPVGAISGDPSERGRHYKYVPREPSQAALALKTSAAPLLHQRCPVGRGPSSKT